MNILTATSKTQGQQPTDYHFVPDGEILILPYECCNSKDCGCSRDMSGIGCLRGTTTFLVETRKMTITAYNDLLTGSIQRGAPSMSLTAAKREAARISRWQRGIAKQYPAGTILERDHGTFTARTEN